MDGVLRETHGIPAANTEKMKHSLKSAKRTPRKKKTEELVSNPDGILEGLLETLLEVLLK